MRFACKQVGVALVMALSLAPVQAVAQAETAAEAPVAALDQDQETTVYLIREKKFVGGGRDVWVAVNDKVVAAMDNGGHVVLKLKPGLNTMNGVQAKAGFAYTTLDDRAGQTAYLVLDYLGGKITEVSAEQGLALVKATKPQDVLAESRPNDGYDNLLVNPELLGLGLIAPSAQPIAPDEQSAIINVYRPARLIAEIPFSLWSREGYAGSLRGGQYMQLRVAPGKHTFVAFSERLSVLNATVEAGKEYAVEFDVGMGWNQAHIKLLPVNVNAEAGKVDGWKAKLALVGVSQDVMQQPRVAPRIAAGLEHLKAIEDKWASEEAASRELKESDGR